MTYNSLLIEFMMRTLDEHVRELLLIRSRMSSESVIWAETSDDTRSNA